MPSEPSSKLYSLTTEEADYITHVLGMLAQVASEGCRWEIALQWVTPVISRVRYPLVCLRHGKWYVIPGTIKWNMPLVEQGLVGPFDTVQEAGATWQLMGCP